MSKVQLSNLNLNPSCSFAAQSLEVNTVVLFALITQSHFSPITGMQKCCYLDDTARHLLVSPQAWPEQFLLLPLSTQQ